jgi:hypothetical protein
MRRRHAHVEFRETDDGHDIRIQKEQTQHISPLEQIRRQSSFVKADWAGNAGSTSGETDTYVLFDILGMMAFGYNGSVDKLCVD